MGLFDDFHLIIVGQLYNVPGPPKGKVPLFRCTEEEFIYLTGGERENGTKAIPPKFSWAVKVSSFESFI